MSARKGNNKNNKQLGRMGQTRQTRRITAIVGIGVLATKKDIEKNIVFVSHGYDTRQQYGRQFLLTDFHFLTADPWNGAPLADILFKIRHTEPPIAGTLCRQTDGRFLIRSSQEIQGIAPGQFGVLYTQDGTICAGSGEITI